MRYFAIIFLLCATSVCLAQETYHNEAFGFTIDIPSQWYVTSEDEWSDKLNADLKRFYGTKPLLLLSPSGIKPLKSPCIIIHGVKLKRTISQAIANFKRNGKEILTKSTRFLAKDVLGKEIKQYREIDIFYDYDSSKKFAIAKILYQHKESGTYLLSTVAKFIGHQRRVAFNGYWKGDDPEEFWQVFTEVVDSFEFDPGAAPKKGLGKITQDIKEVSKLSGEQKFNLIWKWGGIILIISIILGFVRMLLGR